MLITYTNKVNLQIQLTIFLVMSQELIVFIRMITRVIFQRIIFFVKGFQLIIVGTLLILLLKCHMIILLRKQLLLQSARLFIQGINSLCLFKMVSKIIRFQVLVRDLYCMIKEILFLLIFTGNGCCCCWRNKEVTFFSAKENSFGSIHLIRITRFVILVFKT